MLRDGVETIIGIQSDPVFGPVVMFGLGGVFVEVMRDATFRIAPFGPEKARQMIGEINGRPCLKARVANRPPIKPVVVGPQASLRFLL
jgi:acetate---CoA ligase (ADP-forming)